MRVVGGEELGVVPRRGRMRSCYLVLAVLVPLVCCAPARAGTYDVYSCRVPDGSPAPAAGWVPFATGAEPTGLSATAADMCAAGSGLVASLPSYAPVGMESRWAFTAPSGTSIEDFEIFRTVSPTSS